GVEKFLFPRLQPTDAALIDNYSEESNILAAAIGLPLLPGDRTFPISRSGPSQVWRYIQVRRPKYVILADAGVLRPYLPLPGTCILAGHPLGWAMLLLKITYLPSLLRAARGVAQ